MMSAPRVLEVVARIEALGVPVWLDGGWGVDALMGAEGRLHDDLDVVVRLPDVDRIVNSLDGLEYSIELDVRPTRLVLSDGKAHQVDLHPISFDDRGNATQTGAGAGGGDALYPRDGFTTGVIEGKQIGCLTAELQLAHHRGYAAGPMDLSDMARLCARFRLPWPDEYPPLLDDAGEAVVLEGGNLTTIVRIGDTVRRSVGPWTPATHTLLKHLADTGFAESPRVLGIDRVGREVLTYAPGQVAWPSFSEEQASEASLVAIGQMTRRYHDAVAGFKPPEHARWQRLVGTLDGDVVCHCDVAPWNVVYEGSRPTSLLDWDLACPAPALWDVAYVAWRFVPLYEDDHIAPWKPDRGSRLRLLCDSYGLGRDERAELLAMVRARQQSVYDSIRTWGEDGLPGWRQMWGHHSEGALKDLEFLERNRAAWTAALMLNE